MINSISFRRLLVALVVLGQSTGQAASISFTSPSDNHNYTPNTPISYGGNGSYDVGESKTTDVEVELMWFPTNTSPLSAEVVTDYDDSIITYDQSGGVDLHTYSFENSKDSNGKSRLLAKQRTIPGNTDPETEYYCLIATPYRKHGPYFVNGVRLWTSKVLGKIE